MSNGPVDAASLLERARRAPDELEARLLLAACVQQAALEVGARMVLTGGTAADFYASSALGTSEGYPLKWRPSADIDVVVISIEPWKLVRKPVLRRLAELGMKPRYIGDTARVVDIPDFTFTLEIVGEELSGDPHGERVVTVLLDAVIPLTIRGPEDVILAYAESGWHLRHAGDWTRALAVYETMKDRLDLERMEEEARRRGQTHVLERVLRREPLHQGGTS
jgi:hypothetical protein